MAVMKKHRKIVTKFGAVVRQQRQELGLSQEQFAEKSKLHRTYIGSVERGERNLTLASIWQLASSLDISASELLKLVEAEL